ncbi:MAG: phosphatase PAP2 family protein [Prevotellaceae bacterium]|jgi:undecaprenyl-diphosphatase|nr:phosphatase PAP2 family protein [Prevotellaceae bacterium]
MLDFIENIDAEISMFINGLHCGMLDFLMFHITRLYCSCVVYTVVILAFVAIKKQQCRKDVLLLVLAAIIVGVVIAAVIKPSVARLRPCNTAELQNIIHLVKGYCEKSFSFMSSHAATSFTVATFVHASLRNKYVSIMIFLWAFVYSYSRIYLGVHFFGDVLCGALFGILCGKITWNLHILLFNKKLSAKRCIIIDKALNKR